jgi:hypothetical protein
MTNAGLLSVPGFTLQSEMSNGVTKHVIVVRRNWHLPDYEVVAPGQACLVTHGGPPRHDTEEIRKILHGRAIEGLDLISFIEAVHHDSATFLFHSHLPGRWRH